MPRTGYNLERIVPLDNGDETDLAWYEVAEVQFPGGPPVRMIAAFERTGQQPVRISDLRLDGVEPTANTLPLSPLLDLLRLTDGGWPSPATIRKVLRAWNAEWPAPSASSARASERMAKRHALYYERLLERPRSFLGLLERTVEAWWSRSGQPLALDAADPEGGDLLRAALVLAVTAWVTLAVDPETASPALGPLLTEVRDVWQPLRNQPPAPRVAHLGMPPAALQYLAHLTPVPTMEEGHGGAKGSWSRAQRAHTADLARLEQAGKSKEAWGAFEAAESGPPVAAISYVTDDLLALAWHDWWWCIKRGARLYRCTDCGVLFVLAGRSVRLCAACGTPAANQRRYRSQEAGAEERRLRDAVRQRIRHFRLKHGREPNSAELRELHSQPIRPRATRPEPGR